MSQAPRFPPAGLPSRGALHSLGVGCPPARPRLPAEQRCLPAFPPGCSPRRRALADDVLGGYNVPKGSDIFISTWNLHRWAGCY